MANLLAGLQKATLKHTSAEEKEKAEAVKLVVANEAELNRSALDSCFYFNIYFMISMSIFFDFLEAGCRFSFLLRFTGQG